MRLKERDRVVINELGHGLYGTSSTNPRGVEGVIEAVHGSIYLVEWDNGRCNSYREGTLELVNTSLENE